ncbi:MAG: hypothetical protein ACLQVN_09790 [Bryobacteraceae bacterium]
MRPAIVVFEGREEAAEELNFETAKEGWSEYALEGGVTIKMKNLVSRVFRLLNRTKPDGSPFYVLEGMAVLTVVNPNAVVTVSQSTQQPAKEN